MKKLISTLLALVMILSMFAAITVSADTGVSSEPPTYTNNVKLTAADLTPADGNTAKVFTFAENTRYYLEADIDISKLLIADITIVTAAGSCLDGMGFGFYNVGTDGNRFETDDNGTGIDGWFKMTVAAGGTIQNINFGSSERPFGVFQMMLTNTSSTATITWNKVNFNMYNARSGNHESYGLGYAQGSHTFTDCTMYYHNPFQSSKIMGGWIGGTATGEYTFTNCVLDGKLDYGSTGNYVGGFITNVGDSAKVTFTNCKNYLDLKTSSGGWHLASGFCRVDGVNAEVTFKNCENHGDISATNGTSAAGFAVLRQGKATIENCVNYGAVNGKTHAAGIAVRANGGSDCTTTIVGCENHGEISGDNGGGIVTVQDDGATTLTLTVDNCLNLGTVVGTTASGGIVGNITTEEVTVTVKNSYSFGTATKAVIGAGSLSAESTGNFTLSTYTDNQGATAKTSAEAVAILNADDFKLNNRDMEETFAVDKSGKIIPVSNAVVESIFLDKNNVTLTKHGEEITLNAIVNPSYVINKELLWRSSDTAVVTVENGKLTAVAKGSAKVTVVSVANPAVTFVCAVKVEDPVGDLVTKIDALSNPITLSDREAIAAAEQDYAELAEELREFVTNYQVLVDARAAYSALLNPPADDSNSETDTEAATDTDSAESVTNEEGETEAAEDKGGCGSALMSGIAIVGVAAAGVCLTLKKKED